MYLDGVSQINDYLGQGPTANKPTIPDTRYSIMCDGTVHVLFLLIYF